MFINMYSSSLESKPPASRFTPFLCQCVVVVEKAVEERPAISPWTKGIPAYRELAGLPAQCGRARKLGQTIR
jgi:hypothetical protein